MFGSSHHKMLYAGMKGCRDWNTLSILMKRGAPCVLCRCRRLPNGLTWTACLLQVKKVVTINGGQSASQPWEGKPTRTETLRPHTAYWNAFPQTRAQTQNCLHITHYPFVSRLCFLIRGGTLDACHTPLLVTAHLLHCLFHKVTF